MNTHNILLRKAVVWFSLGCFLGQNTLALAQITSAAGGGQKPFVVQAGNGAPVVNIVTPNAAGVSHNRYGSFNVGTEGAILNNSHQITDTALGGRVPANPYIRYGARLIVNEVTGTGIGIGPAPSSLKGPLEVAVNQRANLTTQQRPILTRVLR